MEAILLRTATTAEGVVKDAVPRLHGLTLIVDHPTHLPFVGEYPNEAPPGVIRLQAGRTAKGVVRESGRGRPVAGAKVCAFWRDPGLFASFGPRTRCVDSGEKGIFELAGLPAGNLQATAEAAGFETDARTIEQGRRASRVVFELVAKDESAGEAEAAPAAAGEIRVELVGASGEPIRNFTMRINSVGRRGSSSHDVEDAEGPVSVPIGASYANEAEVDVSFEAENHLRSSLIRVAPVPGGEVDLGLIALDPGAVVQGRLFDAVGAEPAAGCLVELLPAGVGAIGALFMGERHVAVSDAGMSPTLFRRGGSKRSGSASKEILLTTELPPHQMLRVGNDERGTVEVDLQRSDGSPAAHAWLHLVDALGEAAGGGLASATGSLTGRALPPGDVTVVWNDAAACAGGVGLNVEAGRTTRVRELLPMGRLVELRCPVADCGGESLSFLSVTTESGAEIASHLTGAGEGVRFSESGRLGLGCVTPGAYEISFWTAGRRWGAEVSVGTRGPAEEPVVVSGREAGL